jgi:Na+-transporting NADH:ubiquinone oxidoreductase subunit A
MSMAVHVIKRGLDLPITGAPSSTVDEGPAVTRVALLADEHPLMKPRMHVSEGDQVKTGQLLYEDRKSEGVCFTAPGTGKVVAINRGAKRILQSVVIELSGQEEQVEFENYSGAAVADIDADTVRALHSESGLWTALRARPFGRTPSTADPCSAVFVTAIDTRPLSGSVALALKGREADFKVGLQVVSKLTEGPTFLCKAAGEDIPTVGGVNVEEFKGKHPAGLVGTHIHMLHPVDRKRSAFYLGYQDVAAIGHLFTTGKLDMRRVVALGGPMVKNPRHLRTRLGASIAELTAGQIDDTGEVRIIAGSPLGGRSGDADLFGYVGRYENQISALAEDRERVFFGWLGLGFGKFSTIRAIASRWFGGSKPMALTTTTHGSHRAMVPIGMFERVCALDIMPTFLLRALAVDDVVNAEQLGCLELDEEDLAIFTCVAPGKEDYGKALRRNLDIIWKEG